MNILVVTPYLPYPPNSGGKAAQFSMLMAYPSHYRIRLIYKAQTKEDTENAKRLEDQLKNLKVVLCDPVEELNNTSNADEQPGIVMRVLRFPARIAWKLLFHYESLIHRFNRKSKVTYADFADEQPSTQIRQLPVPAYHQVNASVLSAIQSNLEWADLIQSDFVDLLTLSCLTLSSKPKVFVAHQIHTSYVETFFQCTPSKGADQLLIDYHCQLTHLLEKTFLEQFDSIIVFSKEDLDKLKLMGVDQPVVVSPFTFPLDLKPVEPESLKEGDWKRELVFIGSGEHGPNEKGLEWFLDHVYPILDENKHDQEMPLIKVIGSWSPEQQKKLQAQGAFFTGFVDELSDAIKGRVCICPIQIGAGLRTKLLAAAISSSPIVTTSLGCQGIGMNHEEHCLIADSPSDFAAQVMRLMDEMDTLGPKLATNAYSFVRRNFSLDAVGKQRTDLFESLVTQNSMNDKSLSKKNMS